jgi:hypothetical protein
MRDSNSRGVAPNTLSNNADHRSPRSTAVRDLPEHDWVSGERRRTEVNETETETGGWPAHADRRVWGAALRERRGDLLAA